MVYQHSVHRQVDEQRRREQMQTMLLAKND